MEPSRLNSPVQNQHLSELEKREIPTEKNLLGGKVGRTWYGFFSDWAATLGLTSRPELEGKSFAERWSIVENAPVSIRGVKEGHDDARYVLLKLMQQLEELYENKEDTEELENSATNLRSQITNNQHYDTKQIDQFIKKLAKFEGRIRKELARAEKPAEPKIELEQPADPMLDMLQLMSDFIQNSHFAKGNPESQASKVPAMSSLEKAQQDIYEGTCKRILSLTDALEQLKEGRGDLNNIKKLQEEIVVGMKEYEKLGVRRVAQGVIGMKKAVQRWKNLPADQKAKRAEQAEKLKAERAANQDIAPKPSFLADIKAGNRPQLKPVIAESSEKVAEAPENTRPARPAFLAQINAEGKALLKQVKVAEKLGDSENFAKENKEAITKASEFNKNEAANKPTLVFNPADLTNRLAGLKKIVKEDKPIEETSKNEKPSMKSELKKVLADMRDKLKKEEDNVSDTESVKDDWED